MFSASIEGARCLSKIGRDHIIILFDFQAFFVSGEKVLLWLVSEDLVPVPAKNESELESKQATSRDVWNLPRMWVEVSIYVVPVPANPLNSYVRIRSRVVTSLNDIPGWSFFITGY